MDKDYRYNVRNTQIDGSLPTITNGDTINDFADFIIKSKFAMLFKMLSNKTTDIIRNLFKSEEIKSDRVTEILNFSKYINISEIYSNAETDTNIVGSNVTIGKDVMINETNMKTFKAPNYGYIMGIVCVYPEINEFFSTQSDFLINRSDIETLPNPAYANLGFVPVLRKETGFIGNTTSDSTAIGYRPIFEPIRKGYNVIAGEMVQPANYGKILGRVLPMNFNDLVTINHTEYEPFMSNKIEPQIRLFVINEVNKNIPMPKTLDYVDIDDMKNGIKI